ncbi:unnamed protein product [Cladocopium goreaui]|uniref:Uncharacterized protein n=1 Tax=Cladocopium goreaui TaxID=2562237 RepID=A0A9P1CD31_9DINO|nr:unnamed protein product [Cladocopium goreaui]
MMQDPHILQYSTGSAALVMDTILLKCKGKWSNASMTLGGPRVLSDEACVRSILAAHVAWREGPQRLSMVGRVQPIVGVTNEELWDALSPSWRQLALQPVASAQPAIAAFGAWWPVLRLLWADAGAVLGCGRSNVGKKTSGLEAELCLWAILGRLADELRPWEDFVGSDSPVLLSATFLLGWFAMKTMPLLKPSALPAAESLLELLSEIVIAGEAANVQKLYTSTMSNEDWRVLFSCVLQTSQPRRYLLLDRLDLNLPNRARKRLVKANSAQPLEELLQPESDTHGK